MSTATLEQATFAWIALALVTCAVLYKVPAPFGRHASDRFGPTMDTRLGWVLMELPSFAIMAYFLAFGAHSREGWTWLLFTLWLVHYGNRTLVFPFRIRPGSPRVPVLIVVSAIGFNLVNAGLNGAVLAQDGARYDAAWLASPATIAGLVLFLAGMAINLVSDEMLMRLRKPGERGYQIPRGFLFDYVSSPNLFGEMLEWIGFALMAWNLPALSFAVWTCANLLPRARNHHDWYRARFPDYPPQRKVVIPFVY